MFLISWLRASTAKGWTVICLLHLHLELKRKLLLRSISLISGMEVAAKKISFDWKKRSVTLQNCQVSNPPNYDSESAAEPSGSFTHYRLQADEFVVYPSLAHLLKGLGPVSRLEARGITGVVDKRWLKTQATRWHYREHQFTDFWLDKGLHLEDVNVTVRFPDSAPSGSIVPLLIHEAEFPTFRKRFLLFDVLGATTAFGTFNNRAAFNLATGRAHISRLPIQHLRRDDGAQSPVDLLADASVDIDAAWSVKNDQVDFGVTMDIRDPRFSRSTGMAAALSPGSPLLSALLDSDKFRAFVEEKSPPLQLSCSFSLPMEEFDGAWSLYDSGFSDSLSKHSIHAFRSLCSDRSFYLKIARDFALWSVQSIIPPFLVGALHRKRDRQLLPQGSHTAQLA